MSMKSKTGLFEVEAFETAAPVNTAAGFCACACACACAEPDTVCAGSCCTYQNGSECACACACIGI
jgi:hypothetical protein